MQLFTNFSSSPFDLISNIYPPIVVHGHKVFLESAFQFIQPILGPGFGWLYTSNNCQFEVFHDIFFEKILIL